MEIIQRFADKWRMDLLDAMEERILRIYNRALINDPKGIEARVAGPLYLKILKRAKERVLNTLDEKKGWDEIKLDNLNKVDELQNNVKELELDNIEQFL